MKKNKYKIGSFILLSVLLLGSAKYVLAQTATETFSNFVSGNGYNQSSNISIVDPNAPYNLVSVEYGLPFTASVSGALTSIEVVVKRASSFKSSTVERIFSIRSDDNGKPGTVLEKYSFLPTSNFLVLPNKILNSKTHPYITKGQKYWIVGEINPQATSATSVYDNWSTIIGNFGPMASRKTQSDPWVISTNRVPTVAKVLVDTTASPTGNNSQVTTTNKPPVANISSSVSSGKIPLTINFSASSSYDPDGSIATYSWNFGDGSTANTASPSHTYNNAGSYNVSLKVTDNKGLAASANTSISAVTPSVEAFSNLSSMNSASGVYIVDPNIPASSGLAPAEHALPFSPSTSGALTSLEVVVMRSNSTKSTIERTFSIRSDDNGKPGTVLEKYSFLPAIGYGSTANKVLVSTSHPYLKKGQKYWIVGEMNPQATSATAARDSWYQASGLFSAMATRSSQSNAWSITSNRTQTVAKVMVDTTAKEPITTVAPNQIPVAIITSNTTSGNAPLTINFSASSSYDPDGSIATYSWNFGDGSTGSTVSSSHTYTKAGTYAVKLSVTDKVGATSQVVSKTITVNTAPVVNPNPVTIPDTTTNTPPVVKTQNVPPIAKIVATPTSGNIPLQVTFNSTGSTDSDGTIQSYSWTFDNNSSASGPVAVHIYNIPGTYTTTLTVTDNAGAKSTASQTILVTNTTAVQPGPSITEAFTTFGSGGGYNSAAGILIIDPKSVQGQYAQSYAIPFTPSVSGALDSLEIVMKRGLAATGTTERTFTIRNDDSGKPGSIIESFSFVPSRDLFSVLNKVFKSSSKTYLNKGQQYWIVAEMNPEGIAYDSWFLSSGITGTIAYRKAIDGPWTVQSNKTQMVARVLVDTSAVNPNRPKVSYNIGSYMPALVFKVLSWFGIK